MIHTWTEREDNIIRQMRLEADVPFSWGAIAVRLGFISHQMVIDRAKELNFPAEAFDKVNTWRDEPLGPNSSNACRCRQDIRYRGTPSRKNLGQDDI